VIENFIYFKGGGGGGCSREALFAVSLPPSSLLKFYSTLTTIMSEKDIIYMNI